MGRVWGAWKPPFQAEAGGWLFVPEWWIKVPPQPWVREPNIHNHLELNYVFAGEGDVQARGWRKALRPGDCYCAPPREEHLIGSTPGRPLGVWCVAVSILPGIAPAPPAERALIRAWLRSPDRIATDGPDRFIGRLFEVTHGAVDGTLRVTPVVTGQLFRSILLGVASRSRPREAADVALPSPGGAWTETGGGGDLVARAAAFLIREMRREPRIGEIAAALRVSVRGLQRAFNAAGFNYRSYLSDIRLQSAAWALVVSDRPVGAIASEAGYTKQSNFSDTFRRRFGSPPGRFRRAGSAGTKG